VVALLTAMDRPLGHAIGNALEVEECVLTLRGEGPADLRELTLVQAAEMLVLGGVAESVDAALTAATAALDDGRALARMRDVILAQGGNDAVLDDPAILPQAPKRHVMVAPARGYVMSMDVRAIGEAAVALGAGRATLGAPILPDVGFHITARPGDEVAAGEPIGTVYCRSAEAGAEAASRVLAAIRIGPERQEPLPLVVDRITA
jgi:thymidine phosphorylase